MATVKEGELVRALLAVRGKNNSEAVDARLRATAYLWAEEQYRKLVETLARETYLHEELFPLFDQLQRNQLNASERIHIEALAKLLYAPIERAVTLRQLNAGEKTWWAAFLDLTVLKEILRPPHT